MSSVPLGLSATTQVIDLTGNSLNLLPANVFLDRGLVNLQRIFLADCHLGKFTRESVIAYCECCCVACWFDWPGYPLLNT